MLGQMLSIVGGVMYLCLSQNKSDVLLAVIVILNRVGTMMTGTLVYISVPRLFPTRYVTTAYSITNLVSHIFGCTSPMVAEITDPWPFSIYVGLSVLSFFCAIFLNEYEDKKKMEKVID